MTVWGLCTAVRLKMDRRRNENGPQTKKISSAVHFSFHCGGTEFPLR